MGNILRKFQLLACYFSVKLAPGFRVLFCSECFSPAVAFYKLSLWQWGIPRWKTLNIDGFDLGMCSLILQKPPNRPFPLTSKYVQNTWRHVWVPWKASLLGWILCCYIWKRSLRSDSCCLCIQLPSCWPRVPASTFSTVVVRTLCDFFRHRHGAVRWTCLVCTQQFVVATKCLLTLWVQAEYNLQRCASTQSVYRPVLAYNFFIFIFEHNCTPSGKKSVTGVQVVTASQVQSISY